MDEPTSPSLSLLRATFEFLRRHAPFDQMAPEHLQSMVSGLRLAYYPADSVLLSPEQGEVRRFFIVKQGVVIGGQAAEGTHQGGPNWQLVAGECFPIGALLARRPVTGIYRSAEDTFCYELPAEEFHRLLEASAEFRDFATRRIANLLQHSQRMLQAHYSRQSAEQQPLSTPLSAVIRRAPVTCAAGASIREGLEAMQREGVGSVVATEADGRPVGIFTLHDLLGRVALAGRPIDEPVGAVMSDALVALPPRALAEDAALAMVQHGIRHVLVMDGQRLAGVVSEKDLFSLQRVGLSRIGAAIHGAKTCAQFEQASRDIRQLARNMLAQGVAAEQLTKLVSALNDQLTARVIEIELAAESEPVPGFCWLALGSEGRNEQTFSSDQDNAIVFADPEGASAEAVRQRLVPLAARINAALDRCGFPMCPGEVMASNPRWCLGVSEWRRVFADWMERGDPEALLHAAIFFDFRPIHGTVELAAELRRWLGRKAAREKRFQMLMAQNALRNAPPLGLVSDFVFSNTAAEPHMLDLKLNGIAPFVDAARIYALAAGVNETNSARRLRLAGRQLGAADADIGAWIESFHFIQMLRIRRQDAAGPERGNLLDPDSLNELDRRILKEAFRQARKLQARLAFRYGL